MSTPSRIRVYDATIVVVVTVALIVSSALVVGLLKPGHPAKHSPAPSPVPTRRLLTTVPVEDTRSALDAEMRNRGYTHLATRSNTQFTGVAKSLFPFAKKPAVTDVYAGQAHWLVIASANGMTTASDWQSAMVVKDSTGAYAVSREHADLHNEIRQAVSSSSQ